MATHRGLGVEVHMLPSSSPHLHLIQTQPSYRVGCMQHGVLRNLTFPLLFAACLLSCSLKQWLRCSLCSLATSCPFKLPCMGYTEVRGHRSKGRPLLAVP